MNIDLHIVEQKERLVMADGIAIYVDLIIVIRYGLFIALLVTMIYVVNVQKKKS